jgi:hypothetical protein
MRVQIAQGFVEHPRGNTMINCKDCQSHLPDLFLSRTGSAEIDSHLAACEVCRKELDSLMATFALLDTWQAPAPSAFFDQRLAAHLREEIAAPRLGFFSRMRDRILFGNSLQLRPAFAGALALALIVGSGTFAGINSITHPQAAPAPSAIVNDLQLLNKNGQAIQQLDQLLQEDSVGDATPSMQPAS